jgi:osmotically-inducible protein OsmY/uncharacterized protein YkvS
VSQAGIGTASPEPELLLWNRNYRRNDSPIQKEDAAVDEKIHHALWKDDVLRSTDNDAINIQVINGIVYLSGHIAGSTNRQRIEKVLQTIDGIRGISSALIMDDELMREVAASLGQIEHIHQCKFFTGVSHGVVVLNGEVSSADVRKSAEQCAASHPNVRGVINYIRVPGVDLGIQDHRFLQPTIGEEICFRNGLTGIVRQVVINPDNRRVIAMTVQGNFYDSWRNLSLSNSSTAPSTEQLVVIPMSVMGHLTSSSGFLTIQSTDASKYEGFDAFLFVIPRHDWVPPYPYDRADVLFSIEYEQVENKFGNALSQALFTFKAEEQALGEQILANDSLGG